jgi:hypothetical protein
VLVPSNPSIRFTFLAVAFAPVELAVFVGLRVEVGSIVGGLNARYMAGSGEPSNR